MGTSIYTSTCACIYYERDTIWYIFATCWGMCGTWTLSRHQTGLCLLISAFSNSKYLPKETSSSTFGGGTAWAIASTCFSHFRGGPDSSLLPQCLCTNNIWSVARKSAIVTVSMGTHANTQTNGTYFSFLVAVLHKLYFLKRWSGNKEHWYLNGLCTYVISTVANTWTMCFRSSTESLLFLRFSQYLPKERNWKWEGHTTTLCLRKKYGIYISTEMELLQTYLP